MPGHEAVPPALRSAMAAPPLDPAPPPGVASTPAATLARETRRTATAPGHGVVGPEVAEQQLARQEVITQELVPPRARAAPVAPTPLQPSSQPAPASDATSATEPIEEEALGPRSAARPKRRTRARGKGRRGSNNAASAASAAPATPAPARPRPPRPSANAAAKGSSGKLAPASARRPWLWPLAGFVVALAIVALILVASAKK